MLAVEQYRDLAQHIVLQFVGLLECSDEGEHPGHERHHQDGER